MTLYRYLRRENPIDRPFSVQIVDHQILETKLIPILNSYIFKNKYLLSILSSSMEDMKMIYTLLKIFVIFTMPFEDNCENMDKLLKGYRDFLKALLNNVFFILNNHHHRIVSLPLSKSYLQFLNLIILNEQRRTISIWSYF